MKKMIVSILIATLGISSISLAGNSNKAQTNNKMRKVAAEAKDESGQSFFAAALKNFMASKVSRDVTQENIDKEVITVTDGGCRTEKSDLMCKMVVTYVMGSGSSMYYDYKVTLGKFVSNTPADEAP